MIDSEFDQFKNEFRNESNIEIYGTFISQIVNILVDWTIYESFNINEILDPNINTLIPKLKNQTVKSVEFNWINVHFF